MLTKRKFAHGGIFLALALWGVGLTGAALGRRPVFNSETKLARRWGYSSSNKFRAELAGLLTVRITGIETGVAGE